MQVSSSCCYPVPLGWVDQLYNGENRVEQVMETDSSAYRETLPQNQSELPDLRQLSLRGAVACAVRSAMRAQKYVEKYADEEERRKWERVTCISIILAKEFCKNGLNKPSKLSALHEDNRWKSHSDGVCITAAFKCGEHCFSAAAEAAFEPTLFDGVALWSTGKFVVERSSEALKAAVEAAEQAGDANKMINEINCDYERLLNLRLGIFPEIGICVDPGEEGPLGPLWNQCGAFGFGPASMLAIQQNRRGPAGSLLQIRDGRCAQENIGFRKGEVQSAIFIQ